MRAVLRLAVCLAVLAAGELPAAAQQQAEEAQPEPTPMGERVAVVAVLDKVSQKTAEYEVRPGDRIQFRALSIRMQACETTPPWEPRPLTGAFLQIDAKSNGQDQPRRIFSGWLFKESPSLNSFDNPAYDVWVKSCTMSFPETGPDTVSVN